MRNFAGIVHFVAGKGGVGKTVVAKALATHFAKFERTLLIELSEEESGEPKPALAEITEMGPNLFHTKICPDQALYEYLSLKIPPKVINILMSKSVFRALGSAMPGLADLTRLGKIWFHATSGVYKKIVVDMPSSGFVGRFLTIANVVYQAVKVGPLAKEARIINEYFVDAHNARVHLVTLLDDLVVKETIHLFKELQQLKTVSCGVIFINRVMPIDKTVVVPDTLPHLKALVCMYDARLLREMRARVQLSNNCFASFIELREKEMGEESLLDNMVARIEQGS